MQKIQPAWIGIGLLAFGFFGCGPLGDGSFGFSSTDHAPLSLTDDTDYPNGEVAALGSLGGIAVGASLPLTAECDCDPESIAFGTDDPLVLTPGKNGRLSLHLEGLAPGTTQVWVSNGEHIARTEVRVLPIAESEIKALPWVPAFPLPETLWANGLAILPETNLTLGAIHRAEEGMQLGGFGALPWTLSGTNMSSMLMKRSLSDMVVFHSGDTPGTTSVIQIGTSAPLSIETIDESEVVALDVYFCPSMFETLDGVLFDTFDSVLTSLDKTIEVGPSTLVHPVLRTADGRYVAGAGSGDFTLTHRDTGASLLLPMDDGSELANAFQAGRAFLMTELQSETVPAIATYGEIELQVPLVRRTH